MGETFRRAIPIFYELNRGVTIRGHRYTHIIWCDNIYLLAANLQSLHHMIQIITDLLAQHRLHWKPSSLELLVPAPDDRIPPDLAIRAFDPVALREDPAMPVRVVSASLQLGTVLHCRGASWDDVQRRVQQAHKAFWADRYIRTKTLSLRERLQRYSESIRGPCQPHGCHCYPRLRAAC